MTLNVSIDSPIPCQAMLRVRKETKKRKKERERKKGRKIRAQGEGEGDVSELGKFTVVAESHEHSLHVCKNVFSAAYSIHFLPSPFPPTQRFMYKSKACFAHSAPASRTNVRREIQAHRPPDNRYGLGWTLQSLHQGNAQKTPFSIFDHSSSCPSPAPEPKTPNYSNRCISCVVEW